MLALILFLPLFGFLFAILLGKKLPKTLVATICSLTVVGSFALSVSLYSQIHTNNAISQHLFTFLNVDNFKVDFTLFADRITFVMLMIVTGIGALIHLYSAGYMHADAGFYKFFAYLNFFIFNMLVLVLASNIFILFFGWEGVGLCSYLLIGFWYQNSNYGTAARKAFIMNRIGDLGLLIGIFILAKTVGSMEFTDINNAILAGKIPNHLISIICLCLFIGATGKSAQVPLFTWLPDAMAGPTPVSALIHAATMVTAGVYLVIRLHVPFYLSGYVNGVMVVIGLSTSLIAALIGLKQNDIKKVLAYSTVSQLGLMFVALGVGAYTAALFHVVTHAFFKALLFLGSGSIIHAMGNEQDMRKMGGLKKALPITFITFLIGTLAISGFPFLSGFFSKDEILLATFLKHPALWVLAIISAGITAFYMFRMFFVVFYGSFRGTNDQKNHLHESPLTMTIPLIILAVFSVIGGAINFPHYLGGFSENLHHWLLPNLKAGNMQVHTPLTTEVLLLLAAISVFTIAFVTQYIKYVKKQRIPETDAEQAGFGKTLANKFYIDEAYQTGFVEPIEHIGNLSTKIDEELIQGSSKLTDKGLSWFSKMLSKFQNGNIEYYLVYMSIGMVLLIVVSLVLFKNSLWN